MMIKELVKRIVLIIRISILYLRLLQGVRISLKIERLEGGKTYDSKDYSLLLVWWE